VARQTFTTYFVEGTPDFPTVSNLLLWNEPGLIVITRPSCRTDLNSYVVPAPGVRVKLADISDTLPAWTLMNDINERGDILGAGGPACFFAEHSFVLKRVDGEPLSAQTVPYSLGSTKLSLPQRRQCPRKIPPFLVPWCGL
jgi:hypothetical protein